MAETEKLMKSQNTDTPILTLSPTLVNTWLRCKKQYYWKYILHLDRVSKASPLELGTMASEILASYYGPKAPSLPRPTMVEITNASIKRHRDHFLGKSPSGERLREWNKIYNILGLVAQRYPTWAELPLVVRDSQLEIKEVEKTHKIEISPGIHLLARPDSLVWYNDNLLIFEHKFRSSYHPGNFGVDYQSVASCLVTGAIGTIYNVIEYKSLKLHRDLIIRNEYERSFFLGLFLWIGEEILHTDPGNMYPMPINRCSCSYWELCQAEFKGNDVGQVIQDLYIQKKSVQEEKHSISDIVEVQ